MSSRDVIRVLDEVNSKLDTVLDRLRALEECILDVEAPEPGDVEAYVEAEKELEEGKLERFARK